MSEAISPRLFARVERSLRKRLNVDVARHLRRFAAQARTEDDFMAAAARLFLDPRERQEWLASWARRRGTDEDTSPAPLDALPAAAGNRSFRIHPSRLERIREALAHEVGPIAQVLVDSEMARSESAGELLARLQAHLADDEQRQRFAGIVLASFDPDD